jgi:sensor histidine kinase regulating citrate/malate metabolism
MQFGIVVLERTRRKADYLSEVLALERKQYKISKETIDLINIKCHDIKHQLNEFRKNIDEESYKELERSASIYESVYHTGLEPLDIVLTEKTFQCESKQIQMNCFADGKLISFMEENDVYSLFGNALSNAIESLEGVAEEKRYISVRISRHKDLVIIHIENYFDGELSFKDSLPVTKRDTKFHGYGVKSMERIALKYGGEMSVMTENNVFNLDIVIPIPETKKA